MADREKNKMEDEYLENKKNFLDEIKKKNSYFLIGYHLVKNKNLIKNSGHKL